MVVPAIVPWRRVESEAYVRCTPRAKHRGDILRLNPHLIARHHDIVKCWVIGRSIVHRAIAQEVVVARGQTICWRVKAVESTCIGTLVAVGNNRLIGRLIVKRCIVLCLGTLCLCSSLTSLPLRLTGLCLSTLRLGLRLDAVCHLDTIVGAI